MKNLTSRDPGIILSEDFAAAAMIREPGIKLVRLINQPYEADALLKQVERREFFDSLRENFYGVALYKYLKRSEFTSVEKAAFDAILHQQDRIKIELNRVGIGLKTPLIRAAFNNRWSIQSPTYWHVDFFDMVSFSVTGKGTEYLDGIISDEVIREHVLNEELLYTPPHLKTCKTGPDDILVMRGFGDIDSTDSKINRAIFHRSCPSPQTRAAMLYQFT